MTRAPDDPARDDERKERTAPPEAAASEDVRIADEAETRTLLDEGTDADLALFLASLTPQETADLIEGVPDPQRERIFRLLDVPAQASVLREVEGDPAREALLGTVPDARVADIVEHVASDDAADIVSDLPEERRERVLDAVEADDRRAIEELQRYPEDTAGGLMQKELLRVREGQTVAEAVETIRRDWEPKIGDLYDIYVVDEGNRVLGRVRNRHLLINPPHRRIGDIMLRDVRAVPVTMDQEKIAEIVQDYDLSSVAVTDEEGRLVGRILVDDIVDVLEEEATEDFQKAGGMEALGGSYLGTRMREMVRKRAGWLAVLFLGETLTASAMAFFEEEIARAVVLSLFIPLIISSGGNAGSQASTLVIRAMALGEVRISDWWRVLRRELAAGALLGGILGAIGFLRIWIWQGAFATYGEHWLPIAATVSLSLFGVVLFGSVTGCSLPFVLRRVGFDPASASAPFVATLVDVTGLVIYFSVALSFLRGSLL